MCRTEGQIEGAAGRGDDYGDRKPSMLKLAYWCFVLALTSGVVVWSGLSGATEEFAAALSAAAWGSFGLFLIQGLRRRP